MKKPIFKFKVIGLTGSIASGKSTVSKIIRQSRIPVICADQIARDVVKPGTETYQKIVRTFGNSILRKDLKLHRKKLAELIFSNLSHRQKLNRIVHPAVLASFKKQITTLKKAGKKLVVLDVPLLYEAGMEFLCDAVLVVYAPSKLMAQRLQKRDRLKPKQVKARISSQHSIEAKKKKAHYLIDNSGSLSHTRSQTKALLQKLRGN